MAAAGPHRSAIPRHPLLGSIARAVRVVRAQAARLRVERVLLVAAVLAAVVLVLVETPIAAVVNDIPVGLAFALAVVHTGALPVATRAPNLAAPVSLAAALALQALSEPSAAAWPWWPVLVVTQSLVLAAVATRSTLAVALVHWLLAVGASAVLAAWLRPGDDGGTAIDVVVFGSISAALIVVALLLAQWRRIRLQLLREREVAAEASAQRMVAEERTRIARELHDVVAHGLSIITVQASTARYRHGEFSAEAADEFDRIAAQSRQALDEMRGLLRVLRDSRESADRRPQPGLDDLPDLIAQAGGAGSRITLDEPDDGWQRDVGPLTGLTAYRIVQEATSNALRHAPGSAVHVSLRRHAGTIDLAVVNDAPPVPAPHTGAPGHGLVGMAERAASVGGSVRFEPTPDGGFAVRASLPVRSGSGPTP